MLADNYHGDKIALSLAHQYINISVETLEQGSTWTRSQIYLVHLNFSYLYITSTLQEISGLANRILTTYRGVGVGDVHRGEWLDHGAHQQVHCADTAHRCVVFENIFTKVKYFYKVNILTLL